MKRVLFITLATFTCFIVACLKQHAVDPDTSDTTGTIELCVHLNKIGTLQKTLKSTEIDLSVLKIVLSANGQSTITDTIELTGGIYERTERRDYSNLAAFVNGHFVEWTLSVQSLDQYDKVIHSGDTTFTLIPSDTVTIPIQLNAQYSMLTANFFPIRDSVTRCELVIDNDTIADSTFLKQTIIGDTVSLHYDYLIAVEGGISQNIVLNVYGDYNGTEKLYYRGDTTIIVTSGEKVNCNTILSYVGPVPVYSSLTVMVVTLGRIGTTTINGSLFGFYRYFLTITKKGNGTISASDSVTHQIPYPVSATPFYGYYFEKWIVTNGSATIADSLAASTTVSLENGDATIQAIFKFLTGGSGFAQ